MDILAKNDPLRVVFGWAYLSSDSDGAVQPDSQGDTIAPAELEKALVEAMDRPGGLVVKEMHNGPPIGRVVEAAVITEAKLAAMGLPASKRSGLWVGLRLSPEAFDKVQKGTLSAFSIGGRATRMEVSS